MDQLKEIKVVLTESNFTNLVKSGFFQYIVGEEGQKIEFPMSSLEIKQICSGKIFMRKIDNYIIQIALPTPINKESIQEILKRSPMYSSLAFEI